MQAGSTARKRISLQTLRRREAIAEAAAKRQSKLSYGRVHPRKRDGARAAFSWSSPYFETICWYMRRERSGALGVLPADDPDVVEARLRVSHLDAFMKHSALRAPAVPPGMEGETVLWRGVNDWPRDQALVPGATVSSNGGCYTAFSYKRRVAERIVQRSVSWGLGNAVLFRMQTDRVARGTPWVWFTNKRAYEGAWQKGSAQRGRAAYAVENEKEVLLPPGRFKVLAVSRPPSLRGAALAEVAFVPDAKYLLRRLFPATNAATGNALVKTPAGVLRVPGADAWAAGRRRG